VFKRVKAPADHSAEYIELMEGNHVFVIKGTNILVDGKQCYSSSAQLCRNRPCIIGNVAMLSDEDGVLVSL